jgi:hypothetical protein
MPSSHSASIYSNQPIAPVIPYIIVITIFCCGFVAGRIVGEKEALHKTSPIVGVAHGRFGIFRPLR